MTYISFVPCPLGPQEINGLRVPPCNAYKLLTDHLITGLLLKRSEPARKMVIVKPSIHISLSCQAFFAS